MACMDLCAVILAQVVHSIARKLEGNRDPKDAVSVRDNLVGTGTVMTSADNEATQHGTERHHVI